MSRHILFTFAALASCLTAAAQAPDTLRVRNVNEVTIITSKDSQTVSLRGSANDSTFRYESSVSITPESRVSVRESQVNLFDWDILRNRKENRMDRDSAFVVIPNIASLADTVHKANVIKYKRYPRITTEGLSHYGFGFAMPYDGPDGMNVGGKSFSDIFINVENVSLNYLLNHVHLMTGLNFGYRSFRLQDEGIFIKQDGKILTSAIPAGLELKRSALRSNYISLPAILSISIGRYPKLVLYGGAELCFNFNGRIKNKYAQKEPGVPTKYTEVRLEPTTWNYTAGVRFENIGVYAKYSPCPFLFEGTGPSFKTYSVGITIGSR